MPPYGVSDALTMLNRKRVVEGECKRTLIAHLVRDEGVAGSNPATPTSFLASQIGYGA